MDLSRLIKGAAIIVLAASTWMSVESSSVSAQTSKVAAAAEETAPRAGTLPLQYAQNEDKTPQYDDCVTACIDRMELAKAECVAHRTSARNYDTKCVMSKEKEVVDCVRACK
jgi:hypothetical protein